MKVFTYWESIGGKPMPLVNSVCLSSIRRVFGRDHVHVIPATLFDFIPKPPPHVYALSKKNKWIFFDYIRAALLYHHGGWWFDCDILLYKRPRISGRVLGAAWGALTGRYKLITATKPQMVTPIDIGVLYAAKRSLWMELTLSRLNDHDTIVDPDVHLAGGVEHDKNMQMLARSESPDVRGRYVIGPHDCFYSTDPDIGVNHHLRDWLGGTSFDPSRPGVYGLSLYTWGLHYEAKNTTTKRDVFRKIVSLKTTDDVLASFPKSVLADYIKKFNPKVPV